MMMMASARVAAAATTAAASIVRSAPSLTSGVLLHASSARSAAMLGRPRVMSTQAYTWQEPTAWQKLQARPLAAAAAAAGAIGLATLTTYSALAGSRDTSDTAAPYADPVQVRHLEAWDATTRSRLASTYGYVLGGLAITAGVAATMWRTPAGWRMMQMSAQRPLLTLGAGLVATISTGMVTRSLDYQTQPLAKHAAWASTTGVFGVVLAPAMLAGGPILAQAALGTAGIMGSLSLAAVTAPNDAYLSVYGPASIGLGAIIAASLGSVFFPSPMLYQFVTWGGMAVFSAFTFADTQHTIARAKKSYNYDPINNSLRIYTDVINIFIRMVNILSGSNRRR